MLKHETDERQSLWFQRQAWRREPKASVLYRSTPILACINRPGCLPITPQAVLRCRNGRSRVAGGSSRLGGVTVTSLLKEYTELLDSLYDGVYFVDRHRNITYWNPSAERLTGFSASEVRGRCCSANILRHVDDKGNELCTGLCPLAKTIQDGQAREARVYLHHRDGHRVPVSVRCSPIRDAYGTIVGALEIFSDASVVDHLEQRIRDLEALAFVDELTQVANRRFIEVSLTQRLEERKRFGWPFGVLLFDLDNFKRINDTHGHVVGDAALRMIAKTIALDSRTFDTIGRWGGEEFFGIYRSVDSVLMARIAERLRTLVERSFLTIGDEQISVTVSIGASLATDEDTPVSLTERVDSLLYQSKANGRNRITFG